MADSRYGTRRAIQELLHIFACQWANGMLPQIRFTPGQSGYRPDADDWGVTPQVSGQTHFRTSGITQPPIMSLCAYEVFRKMTEGERAAHGLDFRKILSGLEKYHDWLFRERDPLGENLALCLHPWETGTDNSPAFDPLIEGTRQYAEATGLPVETFGRADTVYVSQEHRPTARDYFAYFGLLALFKKHSYNQSAIISETPFLLQDVLFNTLLAASLDALVDLQVALAPFSAASSAALEESAGQNRVRAEAVRGAIRRKLWNERDSLFYSYDSRSGLPLRTPTVSSLVPLMSGVADAQQAERLMRHLTDPAEFWTGAPVPSTAANSPQFNAQRYWSGPSWPVTNWLLIRGLQERSSRLAEELRARTLATIAEGVDSEVVRRAAIGVMEENSWRDLFTTPSTQQYRHAWLWDSAIVAASWPLVEEKPTAGAHQRKKPGFWEYYEPHTGAPLGALRMTWTASLYLELLHMGERGKGEQEGNGQSKKL